jgi:hypothetical protein
MSLESGRGKVRRAKSSGDSRRRLADQMAEAAAGGRAAGLGGGGGGGCRGWEGNRGGGGRARDCRGREGNRGGGGRARDSRRACWTGEAGAVYTVPLIVSRDFFGCVGFSGWMGFRDKKIIIRI